ncbi:preprotein translocase subunit SecY [Facklamia hominis]
MVTFIKNAFSSKDVRNRIFFTLFILAIFRLGSHIPVPGVNANVLDTLASHGLLGMLNAFGGGALKRYSLFAMGVSPYITASIIVQLLQMDIVPRFTEWAKQGEVGRRKLNQWTIYLAIVIGYIQSLGLSFGMNRMSHLNLIKNPSTATYLIIALVLTAGSLLLVWLGEQITRKGIGNGVSILIMAGIVSQVPVEVKTFIKTMIINVGDKLTRNLLIMGAVILALFIMTVFVVVMERGQRRIPVHHARKSGGRHMAHLPLKINSAGVIPVIFASSFITTPQTIIGLVNPNPTGSVMQFLVKLFNIQHPYGAIFYTILLIGFTFFYSLIQVNPEKVAENLQKQSAYIPSVRPGKDTENYLTSLINRLSGVGSIYLSIVALLPIVVGFIWKIPSNIALSGTSLLIVVGVAIETAKQIEGRIVKRRYQGFLHI